MGQFSGIPETDILHEHVNGLEIDAMEDGVARVTEAYLWGTVEPFTEEMCRIGLGMLLDHIQCYFRDILGDAPEETLQLKVLTGCQPKKFLFHVIAKYIFCDSTIMIMPLLVFEITRHFTVENMKWLFNNINQGKY